MMNPDLSARRQEAVSLLAHADEIHSPAVCQAAIERMAADLRRDLGGHYPLVLPIMGGAVVFAGKLLPLLDFPLDFDYIHITRYGDKLEGGAFQWLRRPQNIEGRDVLILDDILDEGHTLHAVREHVLAAGAKSCRTAVFADKAIGRAKPVQADYVGVSVPNRYVFGYGMDAQGMWRNLDAVYAIKNK
ncbi:hypoxanthine-guanine phosphoribosyltransferase [Conchiformibius steedae DSM 2580]|uniref:Hypoxanthine-guanine phosphoribosyltransferase n=1 Tax=Conchiformibius steedae DSM 2580 TaxID=1121352 RepID=A0AAE9HWE0_9NEIS|nr:hypoxanthine-guanine phosphoribosyltransferase [Conchiformibius steedae]QMT32856.1 hypoxanthine-guanine phosphoribosyltransferase [Conchiformibius steedae]URD67470.1 hypoxanthine-guanine phosphoribosyltransferase [Conchiformibius steedae DSM 2580]